MYQRNLIPIIKKPTRVGKNSAAATDHIITDYVLTCDFKAAILKTDLKDHFMCKRSYNEENIKAFNHGLLSIS